MHRNKESITKILMSNIGLFENMLGKYGDLVLYDTQKEKYKRFLFEIYGKKDVYKLFPAELDEAEYNRTLKTLFTYYEADELGQKAK